MSIVWLVRPPGVLVTLSSPKEVETSNPKVGVHTRLTDEVEAWKIQRTLALVREMGAPWIVEYFPWAYIEPEPDTYAWAHSDMVVDHAENQGLRVIARLGMVPGWARPDEDELETTSTYLDRDSYGEFAEFVAEFAARYRGRVDHIIIWNEPNLSFEWGFRPVDPAGYVDLLKAVYPEAHRANPDVVVLGGALAPTLEPPGSPAGLNDLLYLEAMYAAGAGPYFDALAAHAYGLAFAPAVEPDEDLINFRRTELLREIMVRNGDDAKLVYVTEAGWNDHPRWIWAISPGQRVRYTLAAYTWAAEEWPWCPVVAMWMFRTPVPLHNYQDYYAFVTPSFRERPIYEAVKRYTHQGLSPLD
ncbi:MAG: beta-galactosidase [Anaerolineae bacterium]